MITVNPFDAILSRIDQLEASMTAVNKVPPPEIIDRKELQKRLDVSEPTVIKLVKKKKIPQINLGSSVRYDWNQVLKALEKNK